MTEPAIFNVPDARCPRCGCGLITDGDVVWCTFVGGRDEPACAFGIDGAVLLSDTTDVVEYCPTCEDGGWVPVHSEHPPSFEECPDCYNPRDLKSP